MQEQYLCKGLKTLFASHLSPRPALGLIGQIDILEFGSIPAFVDALGEFGGHLLKVGDGLDDGILTFLNLLQTFVAVADGCYLYLVESAGTFLTVTGDEGDGASLVEKCEGTGYRLFPDIQLPGYESGKDILFHTAYSVALSLK